MLSSSPSQYTHRFCPQAFWPSHWCPLLPPSRFAVPSQGLNAVTLPPPVVMMNLSLQQSLKGFLPVKRQLLQLKPQLTVLDPPFQPFDPTTTAPAQVSLLQVAGAGGGGVAGGNGGGSGGALNSFGQAVPSAFSMTKTSISRSAIWRPVPGRVTTT